MSVGQPVFLLKKIDILSIIQFRTSPPHLGFHQATFYLVELFRQAMFYLAELFRQATFFLAEVFRQITSPFNI